MRTVRAFAILLGLSLASVSAATVPRPSPEYVYNLTPNKQGLLSTYRGKVVLLMFIQTTCPHCQVTSQMVSKLYTELGSKGFQPLAVAVNPMAVMLIDDFVKQYKINFPVGASEYDPARNYLQISAAERMMVPQMMLIDQKGVIRMQSPAQGDPKMQDEKYLREQIQLLMQSGAKSTKHSPAAPSKKKTT